MLIRCEQCGYENFPQHRYCGMCGSKIPDSALIARTVPQQPVPVLSSGAAAAKPEPKMTAPVSQAVSGPSFLGLAQEPEEPRTASASYLLEEDEPSGHRGAVLAIFLFIAAIGLGVWHWRQDLGRLSRAATRPAVTSTADSSTASTTAPASSPDTVTTSSPAPAGGSTQTAPENQQLTSTSPASSAASPAPQGAAASTPTGTENLAGPADPTAAPGRAQSAPSDQPGAPETADSKPSAKKPALQTTASRTTSTDDLEADGEKYLYGNGVPQNCERARQSLLTAAGKSNGRAQSILGTMYATGHCAPRDFPLAYRWFAKALHQDPHNSRIEEDLKVLWNQMTADERNLALRGGI